MYLTNCFFFYYTYILHGGKKKKNHMFKTIQIGTKNLESKWLHKENKIIIYVIWP